MSSIIKLVRSRSVAMATGSLFFQGASFLTLLILKPVIPDESFAIFIASLSWAAVIGSIATLRLELLLFQERGHVDKESLCFTLAIAIGVVGLAGACISIGALLIKPPIELPLMTIALALGLGLIEAQSFLCVQMKRVGELVVTRGAQATGLVITALLVWKEGAPEFLLPLYALAVLVPLGAWWIFAIIRAEGPLQPHIPACPIWKRSVFLTLSTMVNTIYANAPIIIASATQSSAFAADFGFIMRLLTGPITLIRQAYGHTYLSEAFNVSKNKPYNPDKLWRLTRITIGKSAFTYISMVCILNILLFLLNDTFNISKPSMIFILGLATLGQVCVNTIANIRTPLQKEATFFLIDVLRTAALGTGLIIISHLDFHIVFTILSAVMYLGYIYFINTQIRAAHPRAE